MYSIIMRLILNSIMKFAFNLEKNFLFVHLYIVYSNKIGPIQLTIHTIHLKCTVENLNIKYYEICANIMCLNGTQITMS